MKTLLATILLVVFQLATAQKTQDIKPFSTLAVSGKIQLVLQPSKENKIVIGSGTNELKIGTDEGVLALTNNSNTIAEVVVYFNSKINEIAISGSVQMVSNDIVKSDDLSIAASSGSEIDLKADVDKLTIALAADVKMNLSGKTGHLEASVAAGAELKADKLKCKDSEIVVAAGAEASIFTSNICDAVVAAGADLTIYGNPKSVNEVKDNTSTITIVK